MVIKELFTPIIATWDGKDYHGLPVPTGIYLSKLKTADNISVTIRLLKIK